MRDCSAQCPGTAPHTSPTQQEPLEEQLSPVTQVTHRPANSKSCSPRVLELLSMQREGGQGAVCCHGWSP